MTDENDTPNTNDDGEPVVMPTAFETYDENYNPDPRPLARRIR